MYAKGRIVTILPTFWANFMVYRPIKENKNKKIAIVKERIQDAEGSCSTGTWKTLLLFQNYSPRYVQ